MVFGQHREVELRVLRRKKTNVHLSFVLCFYVDKVNIVWCILAKKGKLLSLLLLGK